jgi:hypothetical protein
MKITKLILVLLCGFSLTLNASSQEQRKVSSYVYGSWSNILYDRIHESAGGFSVGLDFILNSKSAFSPRLEATYSVFSVTKVYKETMDGYPVVSLNHGPQIYLGLSYCPVDKIILSFSPGLSFFNSKAYLTIKPSLDFYLGAKNRFSAKVALTNIFINDEAGDQSEGILSLGLGYKLF